MPQRIKNTLQPDGKTLVELVETNYKTSKPFGKCKFKPTLQQLTNPKFMSRSQREAHNKGEEIWV